MNYIVLDLEWNQPQIDDSYRVDNLPFEIIEIGAVKLDDNREFVSYFSEMIKPQVYKKLNNIIHDIVKLDIEDFESKDTFELVIKRFFDWCGSDYIFCTWGAMDLTELQRNMDYFKVEGYIDKPIKYYDIQKIFSLEHFGKKQMQSLESIIDYFKLEKEDTFHRAYTDAKYTSLIFQKLDMKFVESNYSIDCYHNPKSKDETIFLKYDKYSKYISEEFLSKEEIMNDIDIKSIICYKCDSSVEIKVDWFCSNPKIYCCIAQCKEHGLMKGKVRIKKSNTGKMYAIKTVNSIDENGYKLIHDRQQLIRAKRKAKRIRRKNDTN